LGALLLVPLVLAALEVDPAGEELPGDAASEVPEPPVAGAGDFLQPGTQRTKSKARQIREEKIAGRFASNLEPWELVDKWSPMDANSRQRAAPEANQYFSIFLKP
jgi:hypothetical protein